MLIPDLLATCMSVCVLMCVTAHFYFYFLASQPLLLSLSIMSCRKQGLFGVLCECVRVCVCVCVQESLGTTRMEGWKAEPEEEEKRMKGGGKEVVVCCLAFPRSFMI